MDGACQWWRQPAVEIATTFTWLDTMIFFSGAKVCERYANVFGKSWTTNRCRVTASEHLWSFVKSIIKSIYPFEYVVRTLINKSFIFSTWSLFNSICLGHILNDVKWCHMIFWVTLQKELTAFSYYSKTWRDDGSFGNTFNSLTKRGPGVKYRVISAIKWMKKD